MAKEKVRKSQWGLIIGVLAILFIFAYIFSSLISLIIGIGVENVPSGNVAIIPIDGIITTGDSSDLFGTGVVNSGRIVADIEKAAKNPQVKAIILEIDSPGGAPVASDEISRAVEGSNKTTVAWIREVGASGAYWIATSAEHIVANRMSITGSIGVIGSYLDFSGFIQDWNVSYQRLVAGKYKDTGSPFRQLTDDEERMLQRKLDLLHQEFKDVVQKNRGLTNGEIDAVGTGEFYLGSEAMGFGLIDELGGKKEALNYIEDKLNITAQTFTIEHKQGLIDILAGILNERSFHFGLGYAEGMKADTIGTFR